MQKRLQFQKDLLPALYDDMSRRKLRNNLEGKRIGKITVIERAEDRIISGKPVVIYRCICDCGTYTNIISSNLYRKGGTKSCGCLAKKPEGYSRALNIYNIYKTSAKNRNLDFNLDLTVFLNLTQKNCYYCANAPSNTARGIRNNGNYIYNGLDRVNNDLGYIESNVVPCCWKCNNAKAGMSQYDFYSWIKQVNKVITSIV